MESVAMSTVKGEAGFASVPVMNKLRLRRINLASLETFGYLLLRNKTRS